MWKQTVNARLPEIGLPYTNLEKLIIHNRFDFIGDPYKGSISIGMYDADEVVYISYLSPIYSSDHLRQTLYFFEDKPSMYRFAGNHMLGWPKDRPLLFPKNHLDVFDSLKELLPKQGVQSLENCLEIAMKPSEE